MKACVLSLALFCLSLTPIMAQKFQFQPGWRFTAGYALQEQDRRLFGLEGTSLGERTIEREEQTFSYDMSIALYRSLLTREDFLLDFGLGYRHEFNTFSRSYSLAFLNEKSVNWTYLPGVVAKRYQVHQIYLPVTLQIRLLPLGQNGLFFATSSVEGSIHFAKSIRNTYNSYKGKFIAGPYSLEVNPGLGIKVGKWSGIVSYRVFHFRQIDNALFAPSIYFPPWLFEETPTGFENYNPFKLWFTVSRDLEDGWWRKEHRPKWRGK